MPNQNIPVRFTESERDILKALSTQNGLSISEMIRSALAQKYPEFAPQQRKGDQRTHPRHAEFRAWLSAEITDYDPSSDQDGLYTFAGWLAWKYPDEAKVLNGKT